MVTNYLAAITSLLLYIHVWTILLCVRDANRGLTRWLFWRSYCYIYELCWKMEWSEESEYCTHSHTYTCAHATVVRLISLFEGKQNLFINKTPLVHSHNHVHIEDVECFLFFTGWKIPFPKCALFRPLPIFGFIPL